jgi:hypothetical protein
VFNGKANQLSPDDCPGAVLNIAEAAASPPKRLKPNRQPPSFVAAG